MHDRLSRIDRHIKQALGPQKPEYLRAKYRDQVSLWPDVYPIGRIISCFSGNFVLGTTAGVLVELNCDWVDIADALMVRGDSGP